MDAKRIRELVTYDPETGIMHWRSYRNPKAHAGDSAGSLEATGYMHTNIDGRPYRLHRLAWLYVHGQWPRAQVDHINGDRADNRIANLREATLVENRRNVRSRNPRSGHKGVTRHYSRFIARISFEGKTRYIGLYKTAGEAHAAYVREAQKLFGEFARAL